MHTPEAHDSKQGEHREPVDTSAGYEKSDVRVGGIVVFIVSMFVFVGAVALTAWGLGKALNAYMASTDPKPNRWTKTADVRALGNMPTSPDLQNKVAEITQTFPAPRLQVDDGSEDVVGLHAREDLLLENYTWADAAHTKVRIPIERAMQLMAARGLLVEPAASSAPSLTGAKQPQVTAPLTNGFARTAYEQEQMQDR
jgi:hypothetical protein